MPSTEHQREVLVIGSGFGGAVAALRLAEAGYEVTLLERGKRWTGAAPFATYDAPDGRAAWLHTMTVDPLHTPTPIQRHAGLLDRHQGNGMTVLSAAGVGGGSLAFTGALVQPDGESFNRLFPWLAADHMQSYYERVRLVIEPAPVPPELLACDPHFEQARLFVAWGQQAGFAPTYGAMALDWNIVKQELTGEREAAYTAGQNWYGLNSGAKKSLDKNYLAQAEATGCVEIRPLHMVQAISKHGDANFEVSGIEIDENGTTIKLFTLTSGLVFLAAGSLGTSELLVRAKETRTLPRLACNDAIGKGWGNNGDVIGMHRGHRQSAATTQVAAGAEFIHQQEHGRVRVMGDAINAAAPESLLSLAMVTPTHGYPNGGFFTYDASSDQVQLQWNETTSQRSLDIACQTYTFLDASSHTKQRTPSTPLAQANMTAHPLGGMVLGTACDQHSGQVLGYDNLYVVDGSLLPGWAGGAPPALTIAALAEYLLDQFIHKRSQ